MGRPQLRERGVYLKRQRSFCLKRGNYISFANCGLPYHIGGDIKDRNNLLVQTPKKMKERFNIDVRINTEVVSINRLKKEIEVFDKIKGEKYTQKYDSLILSPGAFSFIPDISGLKESVNRIFTLRNMENMDAINSFLKDEQPRRAVVVGGGYNGLEMAGKI